MCNSPLGHRFVASLLHPQSPRLWPVPAGLRRRPPPGGGRGDCHIADSGSHPAVHPRRCTCAVIVDRATGRFDRPTPRSAPALGSVPTPPGARVYGMTTLDCHGRIADRAILQALGWPAGHRLNIHETAGTLTVVSDPHGDTQVTGQGTCASPPRCATAAPSAPGTGCS